MSKRFDYIVIGSGAAGSPLASRLSENSKVSVALFEAGGENDNDISRIQGAFFRVWGTNYDWRYNTVPQTGLTGRSMYHPRGRVIGGSTAINVGVWFRGCREDYGLWERTAGETWGFETARRLYTEKIEDTDRGPTEYRGQGGAMKMEDMPAASALADRLVEGFTQAGFGGRIDTNAASPYGIETGQTIYVDHVRRTVADEYLSDDVRKRDNLTIVTDALVRRVLFDGNRAVGVEYEHDGEVSVAKANKEVILSAGAFNTPQILKLSGVGPRFELDRLGIPVVADLPGVGGNLHDHLMASIQVLAPAGVEGSVPMDSSDEAMAVWRETRKGPAIYWSGNSIGFISSDDSRHGPDFEIMLDYNQNLSPDDPGLAGMEDIAGRSGYTITLVEMQPCSAGSVTLASSDPHDAPVIDPCYLKDPRDTELFIRGFKAAMAITKTDALAPYTEVVVPGSDASDATLENHIRATATTVFHPIGTAVMGTSDNPLAVVDERLRVRGLQGLRVADASVMPQLNRGHTMSPTIFIGEHAAELILEDADE